MFTSLKLKFVTLVVLIMSVTATAVLLITLREVGDAMLDAEEKSAENVLQLVELHIRSGYDRLLSDKIEILSRLKGDLQQSTAVAATVMSEYHGMHKRGALSEREAKTLALDWLRSVNAGKGEMFVFDADGKVLAHHDERMEGTTMAELRDVKGRPVAELMRADSLEKRGAAAVFVWPRPGEESEAKKNMGHFVPLPGWGWTLGGVINFDNIEAESQKKLETIVDVLRKTFDKISIAQTGYAFLFTSKRELLIPPPGASAEISDLQGRFLDDLVQVTGEDQGAVRFGDPFANANAEVAVYTSYFKAFDWYLAVVVPVEQIQAPAQALVTRQSAIIAFVFLGGLIAALVIVAKISRPLTTLASYAKALPGRDFTQHFEHDASIQLLGKEHRDEVGRLAQSLMFMETELEKNVKNAIESTAAKERAEREAAEEAAHAKGEFLANMSHEIRTPIHGILGVTDLLLKTQMNQRQRRFVGTMRRSGQALLGIINDILDFSKMEALKLELEQAPFDLADLVESIGEQFAESAQKKGLELVCDVPLGAHREFEGDPARLRQILINLCSNAIKFTAEGSVTVRAVLDASGRDLVRFEVVDTGIGMTADQQARIFDPFAQADGSTTRRYGGTGLGLAISKRLAELMDGTIGVDTNPGAGSTFWFTAHLPAGNELAERPLEALTNKPARVLVVEPVAVLSDTLCAYLHDAGIDTVAVPSSDAALRALTDARDKPFDVVMVDEREAVSNKASFIFKARENKERAALRILVLTPLTGGEEVGSTVRASLDGFLPKPMRRAGLYASLDPMGSSFDPSFDGHGSFTEPESLLNARVLVAEDNPVNQELALEMLRALGCEATLVENGRMALSALDRGPFDVVLMDCQMPEMDGYAATAAIRKRENERASPRQPIVALTANAMRGDREKCIEAGMDDYLTKPFNSTQLAETIERWLSDTTRVDQTLLAEVGATEAEATAPIARDAASTIADPTEERHEALDQKALDNIRTLQSKGSQGLLKRIIDLYLESSPESIEQIRAGVADGDAKQVCHGAHSLKSSSGNLGAMSLSEACKDLELASRAEDLDRAPQMLARIETLHVSACELLRAEVHEAAA